MQTESPRISHTRRRISEFPGCLRKIAIAIYDTPGFSMSTGKQRFVSNGLLLLYRIEFVFKTITKLFILLPLLRRAK